MLCYQTKPSSSGLEIDRQKRQRNATCKFQLIYSPPNGIRLDIIIMLVFLSLFVEEETGRKHRIW
jgi:hypothetical protein